MQTQKLILHQSRRKTKQCRPSATNMAPRATFGHEACCTWRFSPVSDSMVCRGKGTRSASTSNRAAPPDATSQLKIRPLVPKS